MKLNLNTFGPAAVLLAVFLSSCLFFNEPGNAADSEGSLKVVVALGAVGVLSKTGTAAAINLNSLKVTLHAAGEDTLRESFSISGHSRNTVTASFSHLNAKTWVLTAASEDVNGVVIHAGSVEFTIRPGEVSEVSLPLDAFFSMLKASFPPLTENVVRCQLLVDGVPAAESVFEKNSRTGEAISLEYDYLTAGEAHALAMLVFGEINGEEYIFYQGDITLSPVPGADENHNVGLFWVGPARLDGDALLNINLGNIGTVTLNGQFQYNDLSDGLAAYYPFSGNADDASGNGNHGLVSGAVPAEDRFGNANSAYLFDGSNDFIDCGGGSSLNIDGRSFSISLWARFDASDWYHSFLSKGDDGVYDQVLLFCTRSWNNLAFTFYGDDLDVPFNYSTDTWYHLAATYDLESGMRTVYVNGVEFLQGAFTHTELYTDTDGILPSPGLSGTDGEHLLIGKRRSLPGGELPAYGSLDDIRIYTRVLSSSEVQALFRENGYTGL